MEIAGVQIDAVYWWVGTVLVFIVLSVEPITSGFAYFVGRLLVNLAPFPIGAERFNKSQRRMKWWGKHVYQRDGKDYFYTETVHLIGAIAVTLLLLIIAMAFAT